jgi:paraquat-inducible protein B
MLPILWFTQSAEFTDSLADMAKLLIVLPTIGMATFFGLAGIGVLLLVSGIMITLRNGWEGEESDKLLGNDSSSIAPVTRERKTNKEEDKLNRENTEVC